MEYKFTVIIPVYNAEKTICRCLDSLLNQNDGQAQIILINDGSIDASAGICRDYASKNDCITYIEQCNQGVSSARNVGLAAATGEYITFVDSDDYVLDGYFSALGQSEADFVVFPVQTLRPDGCVSDPFSQRLLGADGNRDLILAVIRDRIAGPTNKRFKRSIIEDYHILFEKDLTIGEDFVFGLAYMLQCSSSCVINRYLYCVDETNMNSITRAAKYDFTQFVRIYDHAFRIADNCPWDIDAKKLLIQQLDYLYCRTSFAGIKHCINAKGRASMTAAELVQLFSKHRQFVTPPINAVHAVMQLCLKCKALPVFYAVAWLNNLLTCIKARAHVAQ